MQVEPQIWRSDMLFNYTAFTANFKHRSGDKQGVSVVTGLLAGQTRNRGSIPGRTKRIFLPSKESRPALRVLSYSMRTDGAFAEGKADGVCRR
jgi:hypothetical protein